MTTATQQLSGTFTADPHHSSVQFGVRHMNLATFRATFGDVDARLEADDAGLTLYGSAPVESISIAAPPEMREHVVNGEEFFDARRHPEIEFCACDIDLAEDGGATLIGELEIKGISRPVTAVGTWQLPVEDPFGAVRTAIELTATVDRRDWAMDWHMPLPRGGDVLGYAVEISVQLELVKDV